VNTRRGSEEDGILTSVYQANAAVYKLRREAAHHNDLAVSREAIDQSGISIDRLKILRDVREAGRLEDRELRSAKRAFR
jgi:hypothetical protein